MATDPSIATASFYPDPPVTAFSIDTAPASSAIPVPLIPALAAIPVPTSPASASVRDQLNRSPDMDPKNPITYFSSSSTTVVATGI